MCAAHHKLENLTAIVNTGDLKKQRTAFSVRRNDMDKDFADRMTEAVSVICHHPKIGSWSLKANPQVTHLYLVTDSESSFNQMRAKLPDGLTTSMLYRDYLGNFRINTLEAYR